MTFETKCWERDWRQVLDPGHLSSVIGRHIGGFAHRIVLVNNVDRPDEVMEGAQSLVSQGVVDEAVFVPDFVEPVLSAFGLTSEDLGKGYWYSTAELVGIRLCTTRFLLHYASDVVLGHESDWVARGCDQLSEKPEVVCVNPVWNGRLEDAKQHSLRDEGAYSIGRGFSDQCYLVEADRWRNADLRAIGEASSRFPDYGHGMFEQRADSWMRANSLLRATDRTASYIHPYFLPR